jgi:hypothetical protein
MGVSVVKGEGSAVFPLDLSLLSPAFISLEVLHTLEYDNYSRNASNFVRDGN